MFTKKTSPILTPNLEERELEIGEPHKHAEIIQQLPNKKQPNKFGHCTIFPRIYIPPSHHKRRNPFLEKAGALIFDAYDNPQKYNISRLFWHSDKKQKKNGGYRKVRSEQRESMTSRIGRYITHHVNLGSMALCHILNGSNKFHYYGYQSIADSVGTTLTQVKRTMMRFIKAGYIEVQERHEVKKDGSYKSLAPIIRISKQFFVDLGFALEVVRFHVERAEKKLDKEKQKSNQKEVVEPLLFTPSKKQAKKDANKAIREISSLLRIKFKPSPS